MVFLHKIYVKMKKIVVYFSKIPNKTENFTQALEKYAKLEYNKIRVCKQFFLRGEKTMKLGIVVHVPVSYKPIYPYKSL